MKKILSKIISKIKKSDFEIDKNIPISYLLSLSVKKFVCLLRGVILFKKKVFIAPSAKIKAKKLIKTEKWLNIENNVIVDALSKEGIKIGKGVSIRENVNIICSGSISHLGKGLILGNYVGIGSNCFLGCAGGIEIGDDTILGNFVSIHSQEHNFTDAAKPIRLQGVTHKGIKIGNNCWIGAKATILDGANIGNNVVIAAAAVVKAGNYPDNSLIAGVPAKVKKQLF